MSGRRWTREELIALVGDRSLTARSRSGAELDPPAWLLARSRGAWPHGSADTLALMHPEDRNVLVDAFLAAVMNPGEPAIVRYRTRAFGEWHHREATWIDLVDDPDVGVVISLGRRVDGPPVDAPDDEGTGEHALRSWMVVTVSGTGSIVSAEGASLALLGYEPGELVGRRTLDLLADDTLTDTVALWAGIHAAPGNTATARRQLIRRDGTTVWTDTSLLNRPGHGDADNVLMVIWDATDLMAKEQALRDQAAELHRREREAVALAEDFQMLADEVPAAIFRCDARGRVVFHNARWSELVGPADAVTRLHDIIDPGHRDEVDGMLATLARSGTARRLSHEAPSPGGDRVWQVNLRCVGDGESRNLLGSIEDVTLTARFRREAHHDALTGLLNRAAVEERIGAALRAAPAATLVLFIDLDGFKGVNDTLGHDAGDLVLAEVARRLTTGVRPGDVVGRYGGDEFIVVCEDPDADPDALTARVTVALGDRIDLAGGSWWPAASIGWARGRAGDDVAAVLRRADHEMFDRKRVRKGGARVQAR